MGIPNTALQVATLIDASFTTLKHLLADKRINLILDVYLLKKLSCISKQHLASMMLLVARPNVNYQLIYRPVMQRSYWKSLIRNCPSNAFKACEKEDLEIVKKSTLRRCPTIFLTSLSSNTEAKKLYGGYFWKGELSDLNSILLRNPVRV